MALLENTDLGSAIPSAMDPTARCLQYAYVTPHIFTKISTNCDSDGFSA